MVLAGATSAQAQTGVFDCLIEPGRLVRLGSPVDGILREVSVERGARVQEGAVVARVDSRVEQATVDLLRLQAEETSTIAARAAQRDFARVRLERARKLLDRDAVPLNRVEELEAEFTVSDAELAAVRTAQRIAKMELRRAQADLERHTITSPVDGVVTRRILSPGEYVFQDREIAEVAVLDPLRVEVFLPVAMYPELRIGQTARIDPDLPGAAPRIATVEVIDRVLDATSNTFGVRLTLDNADQGLPAGLRCDLSFE
jgi:RND family efflux transporter MFP subunit